MAAPCIAIVEDDKPTTEMLRDALGLAGYNVESITSGQTAHERICALQPDLVILDLWLESPTAGEMVLALLELDPRTKDIPVIIVSAHIHTLRDQHSSMLERKHVLLDKPFSLDDLLGKLSAALRFRKSQREDV